MGGRPKSVKNIFFALFGRKFQKIILKVKSPYQSEIQGKGNLGATKQFLASQDLHGSRELFFTMAQINKF